MPACHRVRPLIFVKFPITTILVPSGLTSNLYRRGVDACFARVRERQVEVRADGPRRRVHRREILPRQILDSDERASHVQGLSPHLEITDRPRRLGGKRGDQLPTGRVELREPSRGHAVHGRERSSDEDAAVGAERERVDLSVDVGDERRVDGAAGCVEGEDVVPGEGRPSTRGLDLREEAGRHDPVSDRKQRVDLTVQHVRGEAGGVVADDDRLRDVSRDAGANDAAVTVAQTAAAITRATELRARPRIRTNLRRQTDSGEATPVGAMRPRFLDDKQ